MKNTKIKAPREFYSFAVLFGAEGPRGKKDEREWIATVLLRFDRGGKIVLREFLADLLLQKPDEADLQELWNSTDSNFWIVGHQGIDGARLFLTTIWEQVDRDLTTKAGARPRHEKPET
jgi:hypothetical protein